jgi:hypothetical protein
MHTRSQETLFPKSPPATKDNNVHVTPKSSVSEADGAASFPVLKDVSENNFNPCLNQNPSTHTATQLMSQGCL